MGLKDIKLGQACRITAYGEGKVTEVDEHDSFIDWWFEHNAQLRAVLEPFFPAVEAALAASASE